MAPWPTGAQVEQDLTVSRALAELYANATIAGALAFRGGTALHKPFFDRPTRVIYDASAAGALVQARLITKLPAEPWKGVGS